MIDERGKIVLYDFVFKGEKDIKKGTVYLRDPSGKPVKVTFTVDPLPKPMKEMAITVTYGEEKGKVLLKEITTEGVASFFLFKRRFQMITRFKDYFIYLSR